MQRDLIERARRGDDGAFEILISAAVDRLHAAAFLILHDRTLAEDAVQETMIRAWRDLPRLRDPDRFDAWLRQVLVHTCIDLARSSRHARAGLGVVPEVASKQDVSQEVAERDAVSRAFAALTPQHRVILVLRHYFGDSVPEIADALHVPLGTAKSRLSRAEAAMRDGLEGDGSLIPEEGST